MYTTVTDNLVDTLTKFGYRSDQCVDADERLFNRITIDYYTNSQHLLYTVYLNGLAKIENLQYLGNRSSDRDEILHEQADHDHKAYGM